MEIILSSNKIIEILAINIAGGTFDWRRKEGYTGACISPVVFTDLSDAEEEMKSVLEIELSGG